MLVDAMRVMWEGGVVGEGRGGFTYHHIVIIYELIIM